MFFSHTTHTFLMFFSHTTHTLLMFFSHTTHTLLMFFSNTTHTLLMFFSNTTHTLLIFFSHTTHTLLIFLSNTTHTLLMYFSCTFHAFYFVLKRRHQPDCLSWIFINMHKVFLWLLFNPNKQYNLFDNGSNYMGMIIVFSSRHPFTTQFVFFIWALVLGQSTPLPSPVPPSCFQSSSRTVLFWAPSTQFSDNLSVRSLNPVLGQGFFQLFQPSSRTVNNHINQMTNDLEFIWEPDSPYGISSLVEFSAYNLLGKMRTYKEHFDAAYFQSHQVKP